jgi:TonB family protein
MKVLLSFTLLVIMAAGSPAASSAQSQPSALVVEAVAPVYPQAAISPKPMMGSARVEVQVTAAGSVVSTRLAAGHPILYQAAEAAARRWVFSPSGGAGARTITLLFKFTFVDYRTPEGELGPVFRPPFEVEVRAREPVITLRGARVRARGRRTGN